MTPFLQFRMWTRRAPGAERLAVAGLAGVMLLLLGWAVTPLGGSGSGTPAALVDGGSTSMGGGSTTGGTGPAGSAPGRRPVTSGGTTGGTGSTATTGTIGGTTAGSATGGSGVVPNVGPSAGSVDRCGPRTSTDQGVTATQVRVDVTLANLAGQAGNSLVGIPSADVQQKMFDAAIARANKDGGIRCRTIVAKYYKANPLDQSSLEAICLDIVADKPFALLDAGLSSPVGSPAPRDCPAAHHIPTFDSASLGQAEVDHFAPYLFSYFPAAEKTVHNSMLAAHQLGWFTGAKVVGLLEQQCNPNLNTIALRDLAKLGFTGNKIKTFDFGCPNGIPAPQDVENAVLRFQQAGVTHVLDDAGVYESYFSKNAQQQGYHPKYSVGDQGTIALWDNPSFGPDPKNYDGGLAITGSRYAEENTAGTKATPATARCDQAMRAKGLPSTWDSPDGFSGVACSDVFMLVDAANHAASLKRNLLAAGLASLGTVDLPFPSGPAAFGKQRGQIGGGFWRAATFHQACKCFQVSRVAFTPDFA
jgi:hypothetical protein